MDILLAKNFSDTAAKEWIRERIPLAIQASVVYVIVIFSIKRFMKNREPFQLTVPLNIWNFLLATFSIMGTIKMAPEFFGTLNDLGLAGSYCKIAHFTEGTNGFWAWLFITSKLVELVDTVFLVLRKRPLMFLHWYHHVLTLIYAFYSYPHSPGFNRWGIFMNFSVHAVMYSYYFLRSMKIRVPGAIAQLITTMQILQFISACLILGHLTILIYGQGVECDFEPKVYVLATFMNITYLTLFINFFLQSYVFGGGKDKYRSDKKREEKKLH
uniref:Elongation of very long chain fatty acids protein n=2 Tax=Plectus sambesii TaxID=2011161 RepID=A0A914X3W1_9BILA